MISRYPFNLRRKGFALLVALAVLPAGAEAASLAFRNDTDSPLLVQGVSLVKGVARRGKLHVLRPGEVSQELILVPGTVVITVADANQPKRTLCREAIQFTGVDLFFAIQTEEFEKAQDGNKAAAKSNDRKAASKFKLVLLKPMPASPPAIRRH